MTNPKNKNQLDASKLLGFDSPEVKVGGKAQLAPVQAKVGTKFGLKTGHQVGGQSNES